MHFGRRDAAVERAGEAAFLDFLRAHEDELTHLYLLGDVFDEYIEYRYLVPKGFARLQGWLARRTDAGRPVTYLVGNHDPWHRDYFTRELGVRVVFDALNEPLFDTNVYMTHGDGFVARARLYSWLKPALRHPLPVWLYRNLLPGDAGYGLAHWVNRTLRTETINPRVASELRSSARRLLAEPSVDAVIMGHSHNPERCRWPEGTYLNLGAWYQTQTFGRLDRDGLRLMRWSDGRSRPYVPPSRP
jgi:UDP-2,3-diacylglucosamine hydrolase